MSRRWRLANLSYFRIGQWQELPDIGYVLSLRGVVYRVLEMIVGECR